MPLILDSTLTTDEAFDTLAAKFDFAANGRGGYVRRVDGATLRMDPNGRGRPWVLYLPPNERRRHFANMHAALLSTR